MMVRISFMSMTALLAVAALGATTAAFAAAGHDGGHGDGHGTSGGVQTDGHHVGDRGAADTRTSDGHHGGGHGDGSGHHGAAIGEAGDPDNAARTVRVSMRDNYFEPERVSVARGETVLFRIVNEGDLVHEFNIGTAAMHRAHGDEMQRMMAAGVLEPDNINESMMASHGMSHDDPGSVLLEPGESAEIAWTFNTDADLQFACNVPGHYASGMHGDIRLN